MASSLFMATGERKDLIRAREQLGLQRPEFAKAIKASRHFVFSVETGLRDPSLEIVRRWVEALGPGATMDLFKQPPLSEPLVKQLRAKRRILQADQRIESAKQRLERAKQQLEAAEQLRQAARQPQQTAAE